MVRIRSNVKLMALISLQDGSPKLNKFIFGSIGSLNNRIPEIIFAKRIGKLPKIIKAMAEKREKEVEVDSL